MGARPGKGGNCKQAFCELDCGKEYTRMLRIRTGDVLRRSKTLHIYSIQIYYCLDC
jgi:hypothetical protein